MYFEENDDFGWGRELEVFLLFILSIGAVIEIVKLRDKKYWTDCDEIRACVVVSLFCILAWCFNYKNE